jgi:deoxyribodipyrimidine photo-lyase
MWLGDGANRRQRSRRSDGSICDHARGARRADRMPGTFLHTSIVWFRRDLRLADHLALEAARRRGGRVVCAYIHAPDEEAPWAPGAASRWWLHRSLQVLSKSLQRCSAQLVVRRGPTAKALLALAQETGATHVDWHRLYEPAVVARDAAVSRELEAADLIATAHRGALLFEPDEIRSGGGAPYKVFTPFWRNARARLAIAAPARAPTRIDSGEKLPSLQIDALALAPRIAWDTGLAETWTPGEAGAREMLDLFLDDAVGTYADSRDRPARHGTSRLSPYLHFGEITARDVIATIRARGELARAEDYVRELGWREFSHHLLATFPEFPEQPLNPKYRAFPWAADDDIALQRWRTGTTGIPIVDAGMRELWHTGWMHNRVRMLVASFLTKNLRQHWLHGARWFWDTLVDADLANNTQGWQWTAGCGSDAAPYFRVFNPVTQGERFDADGIYVRRHVPELANVPKSHVHRPWELDAATRQRLGAAGYPAPMVDLGTSREAALAAWQTLRV